MNRNNLKIRFIKELKETKWEFKSFVAKAQELQESNWLPATLIMKKIQDEWKQIGHVPRKHSDKIWKSRMLQSLFQ
jgi:hypothetical protein